MTTSRSVRPQQLIAPFQKLLLAPRSGHIPPRLVASRVGCDNNGRLLSLCVRALSVSRHISSFANTPLSVYESAVKSGRLRADERQVKAVHQLQSVWNECVQQIHDTTPADTAVDSSGPHSVPSRSFWGGFSSLFNRNDSGGVAHSSSSSSVLGMYMYGGVGSGKTMLMNMFYETLPLQAESIERTFTRSCSTCTVAFINFAVKSGNTADPLP